LMNLLIAAFAWSQFVLPQSRFYERQRHIEDAANAFESSANARLCLTMSDDLDLWQAIDLRWRVFPQIAPLTSGTPDTCVRGSIDPVVGPDTTDSRRYLIEMEASPANDGMIAGLFIEPGSALDTWRQTHAAPAMESFAPLASSEWHADVELHDPEAIPNHIKPGDTVEIALKFEHGGAESRWTPRQYGRYPIRVGARVTPDGSDKAAGEYRTPFGKEIDPGQSGSATITIGPFADAGSYRARIGIVQEHVAWFSGFKEIQFEVGER